MADYFPFLPIVVSTGVGRMKKKLYYYVKSREFIRLKFIVILSWAVWRKKEGNISARTPPYVVVAAVAVGAILPVVTIMWEQAGPMLHFTRASSLRRQLLVLVSWKKKEFLTRGFFEVCMSRAGKNEMKKNIVHFIVPYVFKGLFDEIKSSIFCVHIYIKRQQTPVPTGFIKQPSE